MKPRIAGITPVILAALLSAAHAAAADEARAWHNWRANSGSEISARFVSLHANTLTLEKKDGKTLSLDIKNLDPASRRQAEQEAQQKADQPISELRNMEFVRIPNGRFTMGSPVKEPGRATNGEPQVKPVIKANGEYNPADFKPKPDYEPVRKVSIKRDFWMKKTEVTWAEWNALLKHAEPNGYLDIGAGRNGYLGDASGSHPVTEITWLDAVKWCNLKSQVENRQPVYHTTNDLKDSPVFKNGPSIPFVNWKANGYRLPTEAEWEFACREGKDDADNPFHDKPDLIAWYGANSGGNTHPVGTRIGKPHRYELLDMHGNVAEWCWDWANLLVEGRFDDPPEPDTGTLRVFRGGSWADPLRNCRAAYRGSFSPAPPMSCTIGFRPVCGGDPKQETPQP